MAEIETDVLEMDAEPVEVEPSEVPEQGLDSGASTEGGVDVEAEILFQVAHYTDEYGGPASLADIAFEIQEKNTDVHKAMEKAVKAGIPKVEPAVKSLLEQGLIVETEYGGYITTPEGDKMLGDVQGELGNTYESDKNKGNPEGEGEADEFGVPSDVEGDVEEFDDEGKDESGVPFMTI